MADVAIKPGKYDRSIIEGPIGAAVWKLAWPTMLQNVIAGLQGMIDHAMVGHFVGFVGNAAIGVSWQIFLVVIAFIMSLFIGMGVLVARFAGAGDEAMVDRVVYQAFLTAIGGSFFAQYFQFLDPTHVVSPELSFQFALLPALGGLGTTIGPVLGAFAIMPLSEMLRSYLGSAFQGLHLAIYGGFLIVVMLYFPSGIAGALQQPRAGRPKSGL